MHDTEFNAGFDKALPDIHTMGTMLFDPVWASQDHPSTCLELLHVIKGSVCLVLEGERFEAGAGDTLLVPPDRLHRDEFDVEKGLEIFFCSVSWEHNDSYCSRVSNAALQNMTPHRKGEVAGIFDQLRHDLAGPGEVDRLVARTRILTILMLILRETTDRASEDGSAADGVYRHERGHQLILQAKQYLAEHYAECISLADIATALNVSGYYLSHLFSAQSDFTLFAYLTDVRMNKAQALLLEGRLNVSEVGQAVGYDNSNAFSKAFKKYVGGSPRQYVAQHLRRQRTATSHP